MFRQLLVIVLLGLALSIPVQAAQDVYGPITRTDTLWNIAEKLNPDKKASIQQVMLAIYEKNKHAFTVNNINSLRKDAYMLAPTSEEVFAVSRKTAVSMVQRHNTRWKQGRYVAIHDPVPAELTAKLSGTASAEAEKTTVTQAESETAQIAEQQSAENVAEESVAQEVEVAAAEDAVPESIVEGMPLKDQLHIVMQELNKARRENRLLRTELQQTRDQQKQSQAKNQQPDPEIQVQLDALRRELAELRTILTQKDNHIKTLQASLKSASEAIKSQHADNMRLYNKLKELSPESVPAQAGQQSGKSQIKLAAVTEDALTTAAASEGEVDPAQVWADGNDNTTATAVQSGETDQDPDQAASGAEKTVSLSQLVSTQVGLSQAGDATGDARYTVSPVAWAAVLLSFVFILFLVIRALVIQNEIRKFDREDRL
ncbi:MAG: FimV/HubP family polar landmark protein [Thiolinea sp.]